jgi:hypothetical protein
MCRLVLMIGLVKTVTADLISRYELTASAWGRNDAAARPKAGNPAGSQLTERLRLALLSDVTLYDLAIVHAPKTRYAHAHCR